VTTQADLVQVMRDLLDDQDDRTVDLARKGRLLNMGLSAMFPKIYFYQRDDSLVLEEATYEYALPAGFLVVPDAGGPDRVRVH